MYSDKTQKMARQLFQKSCVRADGICIKKCPFDAIVIVNLAKELGEDKIHQFGINTFRLYRLPSLRKGSVVGLLGRNGMGKTTIVDILAGNTKPNFGQYDNNIGWDEVIKKFQGTELKSHFEKIASGELLVSIKPQSVYMIPKAFKGTAKDLLQKYNERNILDKLVSDLDLKYALDRNVAELWRRVAEISSGNSC